MSSIRHPAEFKTTECSKCDIRHRCCHRCSDDWFRCTFGGPYEVITFKEEEANQVKQVNEHTAH